MEWMFLELFEFNSKFHETKNKVYLKLSEIGWIFTKWAVLFFLINWEIPRNFLGLKSWPTHHDPGKEVRDQLKSTQHR